MRSHDRYELFEVPNFGQDIVQDVGDTLGGGGKKERRDGDKRAAAPDNNAHHSFFVLLLSICISCSANRLDGNIFSNISMLNFCCFRTDKSIRMHPGDWHNHSKPAR